MKKSNKCLIRRFFWYIIGFMLFYAPLALFQRFLISVLNLKGSEDIHGACFRMAIQGLLTGKGVEIYTTSGIVVLLVLLAAVLFGPVFCGKFCAAGALSEYLSRIVPEKLKINWQKHINPAPIRYGVLAGFLIVPSLGLSVTCAYCNYSFMEKIILGGYTWKIGVLGSTTILTAFIWLIVLGAFTKGGRGYCSYLCPIGAAQSLLHVIGTKFSFTFKLKYNRVKCVSCNICVKECPMGALQNTGSGLRYNIHNCITCQQCKNVCPQNAISYGRGKAFENPILNSTVQLSEVELQRGE